MRVVIGLFVGWLVFTGRVDPLDPITGAGILAVSAPLVLVVAIARDLAKPTLPC